MSTPRHEATRQARPDVRAARADLGVGAGSNAETGLADAAEPRCPLCENHCPLSAPSCGKGRAYARSAGLGS